MPRHELSVSKLLVSVRSLEDAKFAVEGGADLLDVKEPTQGSLGMADIGIVREISERIRRDETPIPLSVALGELVDWMEVDSPPLIPAEVSFAKLGLSRLSSTKAWSIAWHSIRQRFDEKRDHKLKWVAVAYADNDLAQAPRIDEVLSAAIETDCAGMLIDTFCKSGGSLLNYVTAAGLIELAGQCHAAGMFLALAGSLNIRQLELLADVPVDVIAIRSAACHNGDRNGVIDSCRVRTFRSALSLPTADSTSVQEIEIVPCPGGKT